MDISVFAKGAELQSRIANLKLIKDSFQASYDERRLHCRFSVELIGGFNSTTPMEIMPIRQVENCYIDDFKAIIDAIDAQIVMLQKDFDNL